MFTFGDFFGVNTSLTIVNFKLPTVQQQLKRFLNI